MLVRLSVTYFSSWTAILAPRLCCHQTMCAVQITLCSKVSFVTSTSESDQWKASRGPCEYLQKQSSATAVSFGGGAFGIHKQGTNKLGWSHSLELNSWDVQRCTEEAQCSWSHHGAASQRSWNGAVNRFGVDKGYCSNEFPSGSTTGHWITCYRQKVITWLGAAKYRSFDQALWDKRGTAPRYWWLDFGNEHDEA